MPAAHHRPHGRPRSDCRVSPLDTDSDVFYRLLSTRRASELISEDLWGRDSVICNLVFVRMSAPDLDEAECFLKAFGMIPSARTNSAICIRRTDSAHHIYITELGEPRVSIRALIAPAIRGVMEPVQRYRPLLRFPIVVSLHDVQRLTWQVNARAQRAGVAIRKQSMVLDTIYQRRS